MTTADRFTDEDRSIAAEAMRVATRRWCTRDGWEAEAGRLAVYAAPVGAHAIGCSLHDLRDSEVEWLEATARRMLGLDPEATP